MARPAAAFADLLGAWGPRLAFGVRLWVSVSLALFISFWLQLDTPSWAGTSAAIVCQPQLGASLRKGWYRLVGTVIGAVAIVFLTAFFPQDRILFLISLALWGAACALAATVLQNFASYAAALAGYTAAIIASDQLGATGGLNGQAFTLAIARASEICIGIVSAGVVLALTDFGSAPRRLAALIAGLTSKMMDRFIGMLHRSGADFLETQTARREFTRQVIALDPIIDQSLGESARIRYHSPMLQRAVDGLFAVLTGWRAVANHLARLREETAREGSAAVLQGLSPELLAPFQPADARRWLADPAGLHRICEAAARRLIDLEADTPSLRLIADRTALMLSGLADALNGLALLVGGRARSLPRHGMTHVRVADWLPGLVNAGRSFVTICAAALFWIVSAWPSGALAVTFTAITVILLAPRADQAYASALEFGIGTFLAAIGAAVIGFAVLPALPKQPFVALSVVLGLYLIPSGAMMMQPWRGILFLAMTANLIPILGPTNPETYDTVAFYNSAVAIIVGVGVAALSYRLMPPLFPAYRARRLLNLTLRDLRRLAIGRVPGAWEGRVYGRLSAMPDQATPLQRGQLMAALSAGSEIIRLRRIVRRSNLGIDLDSALRAVAVGDMAVAVAAFSGLDAALATRGEDGPETQTVLRARAAIIGLSEALSQHADYFEQGARP
jgi:uncharacterized membrane protein YccC